MYMPLYMLLCHGWITRYYSTAVTLGVKDWEKEESDLAQSCLILCNAMDCSPPGSSVHGFFQARILEWVAIPFSRGSSWLRDQTWISWIAGRLTGSLSEPPGKQKIRWEGVNLEEIFILCSFCPVLILHFLTRHTCYFLFGLSVRKRGRLYNYLNWKKKEKRKVAKKKRKTAFYVDNENKHINSSIYKVNLQSLLS